MATLISNGSSVPHASGHEDFLARLVRFLTGVNYPTFSGTGGVRPRFIRAKASAVSETWTITCTNAGTGTFSVTGSVSGAQAAATVGTPYDNGKIAFTLTNVSGAPVLSDVITIVATAGTLVAAGQAWELIKQAAPVVDEVHVFLRGLGNSGSDQIFVGLRAYKSVASDWYNLSLYGATGYIESVTSLASLPGVSTPVDVCMTSSAMPYWFIANGRRFMFVAKVSTVYECGHLGFILPTGTPSEYPYPLLIGGSQRDQSKRWSDTLEAHRAFWNSGGACQLREKGGAWLKVQNFNTPTADVSTTPFRDITFGTCIDGSYQLYPVTIHSSVPSVNVLGDIEGVFMVSGSANPSENLVQVAGVDHLVVQNVYRTTTNEYAAFRLE